FELECSDQFGSAGSRGRGRHAVQPCLQVQLGTAGEAGISAAALSDVADAFTHPLWLAQQVATGDSRLATAGLEQRGQHAQGRCLAGAIRAEETKHLAAEHGQVHAGDGDNIRRSAAAKGLSESARLDRRRACIDNLHGSLEKSKTRLNICQAPLHFGGRFSENAAMPSAASWLMNSRHTASRSRARAPSRGRSAPIFAATLMLPTARLGPRASLATPAMLSSSKCSAGKTRSTRPSSSARAGPTGVPERSMSSARVRPIRRVNRWVPPLPGSRPRLTSGTPRRYSPSAAKRKSHARAISRPPPRAWPAMAATNTFGVRSIFKRISWAWSTVITRSCCVLF